VASRIKRFLVGGIPPSGIPTRAQREYYTANIAGTVPGASVIGEIGTRVGGSLLRRAGSALVRQGVRRFFRSIKGKISGVKPGAATAAARRTIAGGSKVTSGKLILGGKQAFRAGGTAFNIRNAAKVGAAAVGVGSAVVIGKNARPTAAVSRASVASSSVGMAHPAPHASSSPASSPITSSSGPRRCCPPGARMLCFKRKHNPQAEAKRRARRKAAREKSKSKTAKRTAKARAAVARRKASRGARKVRKAISRARGRR
jgi:hypothetical protein